MKKKATSILLAIALVIPIFNFGLYPSLAQRYNHYARSNFPGLGDVFVEPSNLVHINVDGDFSMSREKDERYWAHHKVGEISEYGFSFTDAAEMWVSEYGGKNGPHRHGLVAENPV